MSPESGLPPSRPADPIQLGPSVVKNRLFLPPHGTNYTEVAGNDRLADHYRARAEGGVGLIIHEAVPVHPSGARLSGKVHGWRPESVDGFAKVAAAVRPSDTRVFVQLYHVGRQMTPGKGMRAAWGPSTLPCPENRSPVHPMTADDIRVVVEGFATSALHASRGGLDGVEVHAAHGYLITAFASPFSNERTDEYGGSFGNRMRFALEVFEAVERSLSDDCTLGLRVSAEELVENGLTVADTCEMLDHLRARVRMDYVSVSLGNYTSHENVVPDHTFPPRFNAERAGMIRAAVSPVPVLLAGRVRDAQDAERILANGQADMVGAVRAQIADPNWAHRVLDSGSGKPLRPCIYCNQDCRTNLGKGLPIACSINPEVGAPAGPTLVQLGCGAPRTIVVVGGGPAGLTAAIEARRQGRPTLVFEESGGLGGQLRIAAAARDRVELGGYLAHLTGEFLESGATLRLGHRATPTDVPDGSDVIVAVGGRQRLPVWAAKAAAGGLDVRSSWTSLAADDDPPSIVLVDDGEDNWQFASTVDELVRRGADVTVVTEAPYPGWLLPPLSVRPFQARLERAGVRVYPYRTVAEVEAGRLRLRSTTTGDLREALDWEVLLHSGGHEPNEDRLTEWLLPGRNIRTVVVGDAYAARGLGVANREAIEAVRGTLAGA
jgi:2,4-dienoyl-CoA reductase-like NADH-dependent reductase (Old Yellow Enzyme family)